MRQQCPAAKKKKKVLKDVKAPVNCKCAAIAQGFD
jgi:hypothetical protein